MAVDPIEVANAMLLTSTCLKRKEGGVVVDNATGNVKAVLRSQCPLSTPRCMHENASSCPCYVSALADAAIQGTESLKNTSIYVATEKYPPDLSDSYLAKVLNFCGAKYISEFPAESISHNSSNISNKEEVNKGSSSKSKVKRTRKTKLYGVGVCPTCGDEFDKKSPTQVYCNHYKIGICKICGKVFQYKCEGKDKPVTCGSPECVYEARSRHMIEVNRRKWSK